MSLDPGEDGWLYCSGHFVYRDESLGEDGAYACRLADWLEESEAKKPHQLTNLDKGTKVLMLDIGDAFVVECPTNVTNWDKYYDGTERVYCANYGEYTQTPTPTNILTTPTPTHVLITPTPT